MLRFIILNDFEDQFILLNVAMGGISGGIDSNVSSDTMFVDYVRVYQNTTLSTEEIVANRFKIFPNPTSTTINIKTQSTINFVEVYDVFGKFILRKSAQVKSEISILILVTLQLSAEPLSISSAIIETQQLSNMKCN